jgi:hypothetical protein
LLTTTWRHRIDGTALFAAGRTAVVVAPSPAMALSAERHRETPSKTRSTRATATAALGPRNVIVKGKSFGTPAKLWRGCPTVALAGTVIVAAARSPDGNVTCSSTVAGSAEKFVSVTT